MNWDAWGNGIDNIFTLILVLGVGSVILGVIARHGNKTTINTTQDNAPIKDVVEEGDTVRFEITDTMAIEQLEILDQRIDLLEEQIMVLNQTIEQLEDELKTTNQALQTGSLRNSYAKLGDKKCQLEKKIVDNKLKINQNVEKINKLVIQRKEHIYKYGKPIKVVSKHNDRQS